MIIWIAYLMFTRVTAVYNFMRYIYVTQHNNMAENQNKKHSIDVWC